MATKNTISIELSDTEQDDKSGNETWRITFNGEGWTENEVIEGEFDEDGNTVIKTPEIFDEKRRLVYSLVSYALGDI